jgi:hypothetical protein
MVENEYSSTVLDLSPEVWDQLDVVNWIRLDQAVLYTALDFISLLHCQLSIMSVPGSLV